MIDQDKLNKLFEAALQDQAQHGESEKPHNRSFAREYSIQSKRRMKTANQSYGTPQFRLACHSGYTVW
jgi:hypothetical protein